MGQSISLLGVSLSFRPISLMRAAMVIMTFFCSGSCEPKMSPTLETSIVPAGGAASRGKAVSRAEGEEATPSGPG
jgi:hypothetical protein